MKFKKEYAMWMEIEFEADSIEEAEQMIANGDAWDKASAEELGIWADEKDIEIVKENQDD